MYLSPSVIDLSLSLHRLSLLATASFHLCGFAHLSLFIPFVSFPPSFLLSLFLFQSSISQLAGPSHFALSPTHMFLLVRRTFFFFLSLSLAFLSPSSRIRLSLTPCLFLGTQNFHQSLMRLRDDLQTATTSLGAAAFTLCHCCLAQ